MSKLGCETWDIKVFMSIILSLLPNTPKPSEECTSEEFGLCFMYQKR